MSAKERNLLRLLTPAMKQFVENTAPNREWGRFQFDLGIKKKISFEAKRKDVEVVYRNIKIHGV